MKRTITDRDARRRLIELLEGVHDHGDEVTIERAGKPLAVVIPASRYAAMERNRQRFFDMIDAVHDRNRDLPEGVFQAEVDDALSNVRQRVPDHGSPT